MCSNINAKKRGGEREREGRGREGGEERRKQMIGLVQTQPDVVPTLRTKGQEMAVWRDVHAGSPMCQGHLPHYYSLAKAVEMDTSLLPITSVDQNVRLCWAKSGQAWREEIILKLKNLM